MKVSDLMTRDVVTVGPDAPLREAAALLAERGISGLPVVDDDGALVGVLSEGDILAKASGEYRTSKLLGWLLESDFGFEDKVRAQTAGEAMSAPVVTIGPARQVHEAARLMVVDGINRLPVVDDDGRLVGILTRADVVRAFTRSDDEIAAEIRNEILRRTLWLDSRGLMLEVVDGAVHVDGEVETDAEAELLPVFVARVPGVVSVRANLRSRAKAALPR